MLRTCILALCVALPLSAQNPPLIVETSAGDIAEGLLERLGSTADLPALESGQHWRLALGENDQVDISVDQGLIGFLQVRARPAELMARFARRVKMAQGMAQGIAAMTLAETGVKAADTVSMVRAMFDFPKQIRAVRLRVSGDPDAPEDGFDAQLWVHPKADTWLADLVAACHPTAKGCPQIEHSDAAMVMLLDTDLVAVGKLLGPVNQFLLSFGGGTDDDRAARSEMIDRYWTALDGTAAMSVSEDGMVVFTGLRDAAAMNRITRSSAYLEWTKSMQNMSPTVESEITPDALQYRDATFYKTVTRVDAGPSATPNPFIVDGEMIGYGGVAGLYWIGTVGTTEDQVKALIDRAVDKTIGRDRLPEMIVARLRVQAAKLIGSMSGGQVQPDGPESISIDLGNNGKSLFLNVKLK